MRRVETAQQHGFTRKESGNNTLRHLMCFSLYKCSCHNVWTVSVPFSLSRFLFKVNKFIGKYFQIFSGGDETTFLEGPNTSASSSLFFLGVRRRPSEKNDEERRRGKYKIKLWQHWAAAGNVWLYVGWIFPSQYKSLGGWAPRKKDERYTDTMKKREENIRRRKRRKGNFFLVSVAPVPYYI